MQQMNRMAMKRRIVSGEYSDWSRSDMDVIAILTDLRIARLQEHLHLCGLLSWGAKRKRSTPAVNSNPRISSSPSVVKEKVPASRRSPTTPLSFPPSDSDETKRKSYRKIVFKFNGRRIERYYLKKMSNEQLNANVEEVAREILQSYSQEERRIRARFARKERIDIQRKKNKKIKLA